MKNAIMVDADLLKDIQRKQNDLNEKYNQLVENQEQILFNLVNLRNPENKEELTLKEAAKFAKVDPQTIAKWHKRGYINRYGNYGSYRYRKSEIQLHVGKKNEN
ncbi:helix-turn-helix domain-containing protein [Sulfurimonas sp.]|uniref:helix-turn-helix domain-containing protein n=1 Tax=Sulfurimonas sp. TaxID=2022749 RepID=UPI003D106A3D